MLRRADHHDADRLAGLFWTVRSENVPEIPMVVHPPETLRPFVDQVLLRQFEVWVADDDGDIVGFLALMSPDLLGHLYIRREWTGRGLGSRFLAVARERFPEGLQLWAFQSNLRALQFYEDNGFTAVEWTDGDNEEGAPDVRLVWRPSG